MPRSKESPITPRRWLGASMKYGAASERPRLRAGSTQAMTDLEPICSNTADETRLRSRLFWLQVLASQLATAYAIASDESNDWATTLTDLQRKVADRMEAIEAALGRFERAEARRRLLSLSVSPVLPSAPTGLALSS